MSGPIGARLPSASPPSNKVERTSVAQSDGRPKQPRKVFRQPETPGNGERLTPGHDTDTGPTNIPVQNRSSESASKDQKGYGVQGSEQPEFSNDREHIQPMVSTPETINYSLEPDANSRTTDLGTEQTDHTVTYLSTTTTKVEERKSADVQKTEQLATAREITVQPRRDSSTFSRTTASRQLHETRSSIQDGVQRRASIYQETRYPTVTESRQSSVVSVSNAAVVPPNSTFSSAWEELRRIERLHREEKDRITNIGDRMKDEIEARQHHYGDEYKALEMENERLQRESVASSSQIALLQIQLDSMRGGDLETAPEYDKVDSNITTVTTTITTITTTITTVTTRIERWKHMGATNTGQVTISSKELEQLSLDLSNTSSQMLDLQRHYAELCKNFNSIRHELQVTMSLHDEKDRTITSLTAEVVQWKDTEASRTQQITAVIQEKDHTIGSLNAEVARWKQLDAMKEEQIATIRRDYEKLQTNSSASASQIAELQNRYDAQFMELGSVRKELQANKSLVEEKERIITTLTAEVDQRKRTYATKEEQITADKEKLQQDLAAFSSRAAELQKRYDAQSHDIISIRKELQTNVSLLEEKEHTISTLTTKAAQAERDDSVKVQQIATARRDVEQLRRDLSSASSRIADLQEGLEARSKELSSVRDELHQIEILYRDGTDIAPGEHAVSKHIARALERKNQQMEELRRDIAAANARNTGLQRSYEALSREASATRDELKEKTSQNESNINSLTAQADQLRHADAKKAERIATLLEQIEKLQKDLSTSASQLTELQDLYGSQSREFIAVRNKLQSVTSSNEENAHTIASLTAEVNQWKLVGSSKEEQIATISTQVEKLQRDLSASASKLAELQGRYEAQSRDLISARNDLQAKTSLVGGNEHTIVSLGAERDQWKRADAAKAEQIATITKQVEELQRDLSASASRLAELQGRYKAQLDDFASVRTELQTRTSSYDDKVRTIATLTAQVEEWTHKDALKEEQILTVLQEIEDLQLDLTSSTTRIAQLQQRYDMQSVELSTLHEQLKDKESGNSQAVSSLISQLEEWKRSDTAKAEQLRTAHEGLDQLRRDLATSSSQIESWMRSDVTKTEELTTVHKELEQLRQDVSASSSQIIEYQKRCAAQSARSVELTSQIEQLKRTDATKAEELDTARKKVGQLQSELSASSSRITEFQQRYDVQSTELRSLHEQLQATLLLAGVKDNTITTLNDQVEQWKREDAAKAGELTHASRDLEQLERKLAASSSQIEELQKHHNEELEALRQSSSRVSEESRRVYERFTTEGKDYAAVIKLTTTVDQWLRADAKRAEDLTLELTKRNKENEELRRHLISLKEIYVRAPELKEIFQSETIEIQRRYEEQSIELKSALAERQSQLDGVQRFVTTADIYADTMIIQMLQKLNAEVQQTTTFMAEETMKDFRQRTTKPTNEQLSMVKRVSESIGQTLTNCLGKNDRDEVEVFLPIAFQAYVTYYMRSLVSSWTTKKEFNDLINKTYERLQKSEAQTISGRWRSLTRTYIYPDCMGNQKPLVSVTVSGLSAIVVAAGCALTFSDAESKISSKFGDKVSSIISTAAQFSKMIGEVVSADFEVLTVRPSETFRETTMEDVNDYDSGQGKAGGTAKSQKVLCSTQLGMTKWMQQESGGSNTLPVIKAKVVLESFLDD